MAKAAREEARKAKEAYNMKTNIANEAKYRETQLTDKEIAEWNNVIAKEAKNYKVPPEIIVAIISRECHFVDPSNKHGCMQVFPGTFNNIKKDRYGIFAEVNKECRNDLLENLKTHDLHDRSTAIKAGVLAFQTNYAQAVAKHYGWYTGSKKYPQPDIVKAVEALKAGKINLKPDVAKSIMRTALVDYNASGLKESYATDCIKRLDKMGYDYTRLIFQIDKNAE